MDFLTSGDELNNNNDDDNDYTDDDDNDDDDNYDDDNDNDDDNDDDNNNNGLYLMKINTCISTQAYLIWSSVLQLVLYIVD